MKVVVLRLRVLLLAVIMIAAVVLAAFAAGSAQAQEVYWSGRRSLPIYSVGREDNAIAITFDCAWGTEYTQSLLDTLSQRGVRATFFAVQFWTEKYPDCVRSIDAAGMELGTHSATHSYMSKQSEEEIRGELKSSAQAITQITGKAVTLFRPPYGDYDDTVIDTAQSLGMYAIQWDVDSLDWKDLSAAEIADRVLPRVKSGSIILCHNNGLHTAEALPILLDSLLARGFTFVPVGELIYRENYTIDPTGRQLLAT